jgi:putative ABC transport system ATP-binding protein
LFEDLARKGNTIIVVTHEEDVARHARRIVRIRDGLVASDEAVVRG